MDSKCLESLLIPVMESGAKSLNSMNETQYNNFFVKLKSKAFKILKELCDEYNSDSEFVENKNNGYKLKIIHNSFRTSQVFVSADANYNYYPFATLQYNYTNDAFPKEALATLNKEFKEYINADNMKIEYSNYVFYIYFKKYNKSNNIATEGLFSKMKEKREAKKAEREAVLEAKRKAWPIVKRKVITECKAICNKYKAKNPKLPWKLKFVEEDDYVYIEVFTDEKYINPYYADGDKSPEYNKTAHDVYNSIFKVIEQKYTNQEIDGIGFIADCEEWNEIDIYLK